jgi:hypothetical protein
MYNVICVKNSELTFCNSCQWAMWHVEFKFSVLRGMMFMCIIIWYGTTNGEVAILSQEFYIYIYIYVYTSVVCCSALFLCKGSVVSRMIISFFIRIDIKLYIT